MTTQRTSQSCLNRLRNRLANRPKLKRFSSPQFWNPFRTSHPLSIEKRRQKSVFLTLDCHKQDNPQAGYPKISESFPDEIDNCYTDIRRLASRHSQRDPGHFLGRELYPNQPRHNTTERSNYKNRKKQLPNDLKHLPRRVSSVIKASMVDQGVRSWFFDLSYRFTRERLAQTIKFN